MNIWLAGKEPTPGPPLDECPIFDYDYDDLRWPDAYSQVPGSAAGYPTAPPADPDKRD